MTLTTRGKRLAFALYTLLIIFIGYNIMTIDNACIDEDLARMTSQAYHYGTSQEIEHAREIIYKWRGKIKVNDDYTHEIIFECVTLTKKNEEV
jgi:acetolactate synthase small subunit